MKLDELMVEMERLRHRQEVYSLLESVLLDYIPSDTEETPDKVLPVSFRCSAPFVSQDTLTTVLYQISSFREEAEGKLKNLQDIEVVWDEEDKKEEKP